MPRARRLPASDRRRQLIESARDVFASQAYAKVGTADLAKAAGVSEPALYRYFSGKKELFLATLRSTGPKLLEVWQNIAYDVDDPLETIWSIGVHYYDHLQSHSGNMKLQFQAVSEVDEPEIRQALHDNFAAFVDFVADTLDEGKWRGIVGAMFGGGSGRFTDPEYWKTLGGWLKKLSAKGWVAPAWPQEYGGAGLSVMEQFIFNQEMATAGAPRSPNVIGLGWVGPTLIFYGTDEQKQQHLPPILKGDSFWCQGFSEPGAGSDLASLQTRAVRDGDDYVINGQKIWTSG